MGLNNPKIIHAWCMYDWANSVYSLVITSAIFPVYYNAVTTSPTGSDQVVFFGFTVSNSVLYSFSLSFSFLFVAALLPLLSGMADYSAKKKQFMKAFVYIGSLACMGLSLFTGDNIGWAIVCSVLASVGYSGSLVFYDAFLPEIATPDRFDKISAKGYSLGYIGSVILLIANLILIQMPDVFGFPDSGAASRFSFFTVGLWWLGFSRITFKSVPESAALPHPNKNLLTEGYKELRKVWRAVKKNKMTKLFLSAFFFYNMGVQTVMYLAATFGAKELRLESSKLILTVLIIQLVAIAGAYFFAWLSAKKGSKYSLIVMVIIWVFVCPGAYMVHSEYEFYILAFVVGLVMGGIQSQSRSAFAKLIPKNTIDHASYFSFYDVTFNISIVVGTFSYGLIEQITGNMRNSTLVLTLFFMISLAFLLAFKLPKTVADRKEIVVSSKSEVRGEIQDTRSKM